MKRRIGQGWSAFCKLDNIMRDKIVPMRLKRKAFNECILSVLTYGCETWSLSNAQLEKLVITQRKMERIIIGVTIKDIKSAEWIQKTEWCDRYYQEHKRKQTQMGGPRGEET